MSKAPVIHPTAEVAAGAKIGPGTRIWQHCILLDGAVVGAGCKIAHNVFIENGVTVGDNVTIKDNVALYDGVTIEDDAFIGPNAVFTNVRESRAFLPREGNYAPTLIRHGATIGANATILCNVTIGRYAMIGAGAVVTRDVLDHALVVGNPARADGWVSKAGHRLGPDLKCLETGEQYAQTDSGLIRSKG